METDSLFEKYVNAADIAVVFAGIGGNADEFMRFLQLEWESYADEPGKVERKEKFYRHLRDYSKYKIPNKNWRDTFGLRDFNDLLV